MFKKESGTMKIKKEELRSLVKEALAEQLKEISTLQKDTLPGNGEIGKVAEKVDKLLTETAEEARKLALELEEELKVDMLGGEGKPGMAPRVGERNRMLMIRVGVLKKLATFCVATIEMLRREG